tara:strand:+ start:16216 stop:17064 length:849 start_codon:yes stop_codon:yes gene_type:complete
MPTQTTGRGKVYFPDGAKVSVKAVGDVSYFDVGCINSAVEGVLNYDENQIETANCGKTQKQIKNMTIAGSFTLIDLDPAGIEKLGGGMFNLTSVAGSPSATVDDQVLTNGTWANMSPFNILFVDGGVTIKPESGFTLTSVSGSVTGALAVDDDYFIIEDSSSPSGFSIQINTNGTAGVGLGEDITIDYNSVTPKASQVLTGGSSTEVLNAYAMMITHTDDAGKIRQLELYSVDANSGGFAFNFKGANEEGVEEMPLSYTANIDSSRTNKDQLFAWTIEEGAQ